MFNIYDSVTIKKTNKLGVIQGVMPRINKYKGFKYYVITEHGKRFFKESKIIPEKELEK